MEHNAELCITFRCSRSVMKKWRRLQIVSGSAAVVSVPDRVLQAS